MRLLDCFRLVFRIIRFFEARVCRFSEGIESAGHGPIILFHRFSQAFVKASGKIHHGPNVFSIHDLKEFFRCLRIFALGRQGNAVLGVPGAGKVGMDVDDRELRASHHGFRHAKHALRRVFGNIQGCAFGLRIFRRHRRFENFWFRGDSCEQTHPIQPSAAVNHIRLL